jgi:hypothetical protein
MTPLAKIFIDLRAVFAYGYGAASDAGVYFAMLRLRMMPLFHFSPLYFRAAIFSDYLFSSADALLAFIDIFDSFSLFLPLPARRSPRIASFAIAYAVEIRHFLRRCFFLRHFATPPGCWLAIQT